MRHFWMILLAAVPLWPQTASISSVNSSTAILMIRGATGNCTLELSESPSYSPLHPDVDGSKYSGAGTDLGRSDTITWSDGTRLVTLGHPVLDRALAAATVYYYRLSGCGSTVTDQFPTATISSSTYSPPPPFDSTQWGNQGFPTRDVTSNTNWRADPLTGVKIKPINTSGHWTWRTGSTTSGNSLPFSDFDKGSGWTNAATILNGGSSTAATSNTNPVEVYPRQLFYDPTYGNLDPWTRVSLDDLGIVIWGSGTDANAVNRTVSVCLFHDPGGACIGTPFNVVLPASFGPASSGSSDPDGAWPSSFPAPFFAGWGLAAPIGPEDWNLTTTSLSATAGAFAIGSPARAGHVPGGLAAGNKVHVAGSSPACAGNLCTIASITNAAIGTFAESVTVSGTASFYRTGVRIAKTTATGSITIGVKYKLAGSILLGQPDAGHPNCGPYFTSGDGKAGHLCVLEGPIGGLAFMYFIADDGTVRPVWMGKVPGLAYFQGISYFQSHPADIPETCCTALPTIPDPNNGKVWYGNFVKVNNGGNAFYRLTYTGDATVSGNISDYTMSFDGNGHVVNPPNDFWTWEIVTPAGSDIATQVATYFPNYNASLYGTSWRAVGISGTTAYFLNNYTGVQNGGPCWVAVLDLTQTPAKVTNLIHTADGTGTNGIIRFGATHSVQVSSYPDTVMFADNQLCGSQSVNGNNNCAGGNPALLHGGPFEAVPTGVMRGGFWSTNTALPWPPDSSYDSACPSGNPYEFAGAVGNQCVTLRFPRGGVCNIAPRADEKAAWPCPWNSNYAQPFPLAPGANFGDLAQDENAAGYRVISVSTEPDDQLRVVAQRNAQWDYCCVVNTHLYSGTSKCVCQASQATQANGWTAIMLPPYYHGCAAASLYVHGKTEASSIVIEPGTGHAEIAQGISPGRISFLSAASGRIDVPFDQSLSFPGPTQTWVDTTWAGTALAVGGGAVQSYANSSGGTPFMLDANSMNNNFAGDTFGSRTLTATATAGIYKIQVVGTINYKFFPLIGYSGYHFLKDVSGPLANLTVAADYSMCHALNAGECYPGSAAGEVYVRVPRVYDIGACGITRQWHENPCVISGFPGGGWMKQQVIYRSDALGDGARLLTTLMTNPGNAPVYTNFTQVDPQLAIGSATYQQGWGTQAWLVQLPPWEEDTVTRNNFTGPTVQVPASAKARVRFGKTPDFHCTERAEACVTDATQPFKFDSESQILLACAIGCSIKVPCVPGRACYYRWEQLDSAGNIVGVGETNVEAVR